MSFRTNRTQQMSLLDREAQLTEREKLFLKNSWAETFATEVFPKINEERFRPLFDGIGRSNAPINVIIGSLIIKDLFDYTDEELVEAVILNVPVQHALNLTSFREIPYSDRTPSRFRERLLDYEKKTGTDLMREEVESLAEAAKAMLGINNKIRRMDSLMVSSNCKRMARLELFYACTANMVKTYVDTKGKAGLPDNLDRYTREEDKNATIYRAKAGEAQGRLETVLADAMQIKGMCTEEFAGSKAYRLLERMLADQTDDGKLKLGKDIKPTSLQNPSDEDATFRRKAGKGYTGYVGNIVECCGEDANIIESYDFEQNVYSDPSFAEDAIKNIKPEADSSVMIADGAYASKANFEAAAEKNMELVTTCLTGAEPNMELIKFEVEGNRILKCLCGQEPYDTNYKEKKGEMQAFFKRETCGACPMRDACPSVIQKKRAVVRISVATYERSVYAEKLDSKKYKEFAKKRNGVEGIPSVLRRKYKVDSIPVFGVARMKLSFGFKIAAINASRVIASLRCKISPRGEVCPS